MHDVVKNYDFPHFVCLGIEKRSAMQWNSILYLSMSNFKHYHYYSEIMVLNAAVVFKKQTWLESEVV